MGWGQVASIKGPAGATGPTGAQGPQGVQGAAGVDGASVRIAGQVSTYGSLPTGLTSANKGDGYLVDADGLLYVWGGSSFPANGSGVEFRGPAGPTGAQGATGPTGPQGSTGATGATGSQGPAGTDGARGTKWFTGTGAPGSLTGQAAGDFYLDTADGTVYVLS